jgi:hypothetical protein
MVKLPLKAFQNLALNEIQHIVDVMREADVEENEDLNNDSTIKRAPKSKSQKSKKKEQQQQATYENDIDTNNNTLKRTTDDENLTQNNSDDNSTLQCKSDRSGIPSVPRVHMGAGFMKIFNQCPLEIHASYCWVNNETKGICFQLISPVG